MARTCGVHTEQPRPCVQPGSVRAIGLSGGKSWWRALNFSDAEPSTYGPFRWRCVHKGERGLDASHPPSSLKVGLYFYFLHTILIFHGRSYEGYIFSHLVFLPLCIVSDGVGNGGGIHRLPLHTCWRNAGHHCATAPCGSALGRLVSLCCVVRRIVCARPQGLHEAWSGAGREGNYYCGCFS